MLWEWRLLALHSCEKWENSCVSISPVQMNEANLLLIEFSTYSGVQRVMVISAGCYTALIRKKILHDYTVLRKEDNLYVAHSVQLWNVEA